MDSCRPLKLEPQVATANSNPMVLSTSSMKSEPELVCTIGLPSTRKLRISGSGGETLRAGVVWAWACAASGLAAAATPANAAPFNSPRRVTEDCGFFLDILSPKSRLGEG